MTTVRDELARVVAQRAADDPHLGYLDGRDALRRAPTPATLPLPDELHPDAATHRLDGRPLRRAGLPRRGALRGASEAGRLLTDEAEKSFKVDEKKSISDGFVRVRREKRSWTAMDEKKKEKKEIAAEQLETYLDIGKEKGFEAKMTESSAMTADADQHTSTSTNGS